MFDMVIQNRKCKHFLVFLTGLVPEATSEATVPVPDQEGSLAPSLEEANHVLATAGLILDPTPANLVLDHANPGPILLSGNPSPAPRAAPR